jgi:integrase
MGPARDGLLPRRHRSPLPSELTQKAQLPKVESSDKKALKVSEVEALARECGKHGTLVRFLAYLGPRIGEAIALKVGDIDFVASEVRISRAWTINKDYERVISTTKTNSTREIPLPDAFVEELKTFVEGREQEDWLFSGESKGFALNYDYFRKAVFGPAVKKLGLKNVTIHTLRHTFASLAISTHSPITDVSNVLGHSSSQQTLDTYAHHYKRSVRKTMAAISSLISEETCKERASEEESAA